MYSLLLHKSGGIEDYDSAGTASLNQYQIIPLEDNTPATYARIFESTGEKMFPRIQNNGGVETVEGEDLKYTFSGASGSGYQKSTITLEGHGGVNNTSGSATIRFYTMNGSNIYADAGPLGTNAATSMTLVYTVSTPPTGGSSGSVTISPVTRYVQRAIKPATISGVSGTSTTKTFLIKTGDSANLQNFAFDMDLDDYE